MRHKMLIPDTSKGNASKYKKKKVTEGMRHVNEPKAPLF